MPIQLVPTLVEVVFVDEFSERIISFVAIFVVEFAEQMTSVISVMTSRQRGTLCATYFKPLNLPGDLLEPFCPREEVTS